MFVLFNIFGRELVGSEGREEFTLKVALFRLLVFVLLLLLIFVEVALFVLLLLLFVLVFMLELVLVLVVLFVVLGVILLLVELAFRKSGIDGLPLDIPLGIWWLVC